jgi:phenylacetate-CoA ligase
MSLNTFKDNLQASPLLQGALRLVPDSLLYGAPWRQVLAMQALAAAGRAEELHLALTKELAGTLRSALLHVPYYRDNPPLSAADVIPATAHQALAAFPLLHKSTVMQDPRQFVDERRTNQSLTFGTSGGSTGQGMAIYGDLRSVAVERAFFHHHWGPLGFHHQRARMARFSTSARRTQQENPSRKAGNLLLLSPYHLNARWLPRVVQDLRDFAPHVIWSYPSCVRDLARHLRDTGERLPSVQAVCLASEACLPEDYALIYSVLNCPVSVNYGLSERTNLAFSRPTEAGFVYELDPLYGVSETCVDEHGLTELVGTSYWNRAMPLIRYRTQDLVRLEGNTILEMEGRVQEVLVGRNGERLPGFSIKIDEYTWEHVDAYQVAQYEPGRLVIRIISRHTLPTGFGERLLESQRLRLGDMFELRLEEVPELERSQKGKQRLIVSHLT